MKRLTVCVIIILALLPMTSQANGRSVFENFITCSGDKMMDGQNKLRFISFNIPNLHYVEDNLPFGELNDWRFPNAFEIDDALSSINQMGGGVVRLYTLSVRSSDNDPSIPKHVLGPGKFNEEAFRALDKLLELANVKGVRIIIPFVDNWIWWGGRAEYATFRGKGKDEFWTDPQLIADFKKTINYVVGRRNYYTGVKYKDDKAILAWETGNELQCPHSWTHEIAAYIKSLDKNHLVLDGYHTGVLREESITDPFVDIVSTHHYSRDSKETIRQIEENRKKTQGKKPYFVGEFGFLSTSAIHELLDTVVESGTSGALIWSLRYHNRDGGFYWHSEPAGGDLYKAYHWPGFPEGRAYDETALLKLMRSKAFQIRGLPVPEIEPPDAPILLPIESITAITWQGSAGACSYDIERAITKAGPWSVVGCDISDAAVQYRPLFNDTSAGIGERYYYRVKAKNIAGISPPSNIVGPTKVESLVLVDEMRDYSLIHSREGSLSIDTRTARKAKEDAHRLKGGKGCSITYKMEKPISAWKLYSFFPGEVSDFNFWVSSNGESFMKVTPERKDYYSDRNEYGYWKAVLYQARNVPKHAYYLKVGFITETQISRVEVLHRQ
jgi:hypothetical protein